MKSTIDNKTLTTQQINETLELHRLFVADMNGEKADFSNCNLSGFRFLNIDLKEVSFANGDLTGCEFVECDLYNANFEFCSGEDVTFINCDLTSSNFNQCQLVDSCTQDCNFTGTNFNDAEILDTFINDCDLSETTFLNANLKGTRLHNVDMYNMLGNGINVISLQIGNAMCIYTTDYIQIDDMKLYKQDWKAFYLQNKKDKSMIKLTRIIPILFMIMTTFPAKSTITVTQ